MMDKRITFNSVDSVGRHFAEAIDITPRGGGLEKIAGEMHPEVVRYMRELRPDPAYQYVLMTPMGAFEYWGMNVNGDVFPEISLAFDMHSDDPVRVMKALEERWLLPFGKRVPPGNYREFGYKTFDDAKRYLHHVNKNPDIAYGDIVLSVWNPSMRRVEVISRHDREKAKRVGAEEVICDIDEGKPRQISMGCKVPFDVCTKCGHISRTPRDYCDHLRSGMGSINPDGTINGAVNFFPRFFDLSDVFVPAAKESGVLRKVAHIIGSLPGEKKAATAKKAEIKKQVLPNAGHEAVQQCQDAEADIPRSRLIQGDMSKLLTTLAGLGIILKPREFQQASLHRMGLGRYSDELDSKGMVFRIGSGEGSPRSHFSPSDFSPSLARMLSDLIPGRSAFMPHLPRRVIRITVIKHAPKSVEHRDAPSSEPLKKVASAYSAYREAFRDLPRLIDIAVSENVNYYSDNFFGDLLTDSMEKVASFHSEQALSSSLVPLYVYNAYQGRVVDPPASWELPTTTHSPARALIAPVL